MVKNSSLNVVIRVIVEDDRVTGIKMVCSLQIWPIQVEPLFGLNAHCTLVNTGLQDWFTGMCHYHEITP